MSRQSVGSLGRRLSWWLAVQTFVGLGAVCLVVYVVAAMSLATRQSESLQQKQELIRHVLSEAASGRDRSELRHRLDDFLVGHRDLALSLGTSGGPMLYRSALAGQVTPGRVSTTEMPFVWQGGDTITATLLLDTREDARLLQRLALTLAASAALGAVVVSLGGFFLVRRGLSPVRDLVEQTRQLAADTLCRQLDGSAQPDELKPLVEQFNALLQRLSRAYEQLEAFNADVAHELCTPLTTLISATELSLRKNRGVDELREVLGSNLEDLRRLSGIVHDMLFLSQADRGAQARREHVPSLAVLAASVVEYHEAALEDAGVSVEIAGDAAADVDAGLLRRALSNLVGNATRYATRGSVVCLEIVAQPGGGAQLLVLNQGQTIPATDLPRLFDRFFRVDSARGDGETHHGLGLAIVSAIARMHGGRPMAASFDGKTAIGLSLAGQP
jgi:two-component system heavy metal sensor histidine kinase CusS